MPADLSALGPIADRLAPIVRAFQGAGHELSIVGGLVRDLTVAGGIHDDDVDLATDAEPEQVRRLVGDHADALWRQGERFGTIGFVVGEYKVEVTTYRAEVYHPNSRKPSVRYAPDLETDLGRRDFTINAIAVRLPELTVVDPFDGMADLGRGVLRTPLDPAISFDDDPLRMLRGARFVARFALEPVPELVAAMEERSDRLRIVSRERIGAELTKLLSVAEPARGLRLLDRSGLLAPVLSDLGSAPKRDRRVGFGTVDRVQPPDAGWRLAALNAFLESVRCGRVAEELRLSGVELRRLRARIEALRAATDFAAGDLDAARRLAARLGSDRRALPVVLRARAEAMDAVDGRDGAPFRRVATDLEAAWDRLGDRDLSSLRPGLTGAEVMDVLGIAAGPEVGRAVAWLQDLRFREGELSRGDLIDRLRRWWVEDGVDR